MTIKTNIDRLLDVELERKDFLKLIGLGLIAASGITQISNVMTQHTDKQTNKQQVIGYGNSAYGGQKSSSL